MTVTTAAVVGALVLDVVLGEPPNSVHPVAWFGRLVDRVDRPWSRPRFVGFLAALLLPVGAAASLGGVVWALGTVDWRVGLVSGVIVLYVSTSVRALLETVARVSRLADSDLPEARSELAALAGRDATDLDAGAVRSAALESLAENLADGLVAPLTAFAFGALVATGLGLAPVGTLALACACAVWIKAVNTMDSMLGYPDTSHGTASARLDDVAMWIPARLTAFALALWFLDGRALGRAAGWRAAVDSPNSGWPMGTLAAALDVRLEKRGHYTLNPDGATPSHADVRRALGRVGLAALSAYGVAGVIAWY